MHSSQIKQLDNNNRINLIQALMYREVRLAARLSARCSRAVDYPRGLSDVQIIAILLRDVTSKVSMVALQSH